MYVCMYVCIYICMYRAGKIGVAKPQTLTTYGIYLNENIQLVA